MKPVRYFLALIFVVGLPPMFLYWLLIYPSSILARQGNRHDLRRGKRDLTVLRSSCCYRMAEIQVSSVSVYRNIRPVLGARDNL